tara:strand:+ start:3089 stop:3475 length:387 start_codon:yes stop_codon:yes gene_type:complete
MREVKKSFYNISKPSPFGTIKKMPFNVPQQEQQNVEDAKQEFTTWFEQNVDQELQREMNKGPPKTSVTGKKYYILYLDGKGNELKAIGQKLPSSYLKEALIKEYNLVDGKIDFDYPNSGDLTLTFYVS